MVGVAGVAVVLVSGVQEPGHPLHAVVVCRVGSSVELAVGHCGGCRHNNAHNQCRELSTIASFCYGAAISSCPVSSYDVFAAISSCPVLLLHLQVVRLLLLHMGHEEVTKAFGVCLLLLVVAVVAQWQAAEPPMGEARCRRWPTAEAIFPHNAPHLRSLRSPLFAVAAQPLHGLRRKQAACFKQQAHAVSALLPHLIQHSEMFGLELLVCSGHFRVKCPACALRGGQAAEGLPPGRLELEVLPALLGLAPRLLLGRRAVHRQAPLLLVVSRGLLLQGLQGGALQALQGVLLVGCARGGPPCRGSSARRPQLLYADWPEVPLVRPELLRKEVCPLRVELSGSLRSLPRHLIMRVPVILRRFFGNIAFITDGVLLGLGRARDHNGGVRPCHP